MSRPEISPRGASCGASIREPAMFCPDCGKPLSRPAPEPEPHVAAEAGAPAVANVTAQDSGKKLDRPADPVSKARTYGRGRDRLHPAPTATRGALGANLTRVPDI